MYNEWSSQPAAPATLVLVGGEDFILGNPTFCFSSLISNEQLPHQSLLPSPQSLLAFMLTSNKTSHCLQHAFLPGDSLNFLFHVPLAQWAYLLISGATSLKRFFMVQNPNSGMAHKAPSWFLLYLSVPLVALTLKPQPFAHFSDPLAWNARLTSTSFPLLYPHLISIHLPNATSPTIAHSLWASAAVLQRHSWTLGYVSRCSPFL